MNSAARWLAIGLLVSSCGFLHAASTRSEVETLDGPFEADLSRISNLRLHLRDGDFRIVGSDASDITIHADGKNRALARNMQVRLKRTADSLDITFSHVPKNEFQVTISVPR